ncbi:MAG TPA: hypothetical protein VJX68_00325 [Candidatus Binatus sp.]|uniref:hypothetical protein n=1 Tax=Candidatus Binatus sp. TaxID=2811406 RepID=UPI002B46D4F0|nr:hypothetical protein [Candidatus Binatus sp.]HKN11617.1 hypothetical protein [Candidatus Binatus sp.]
MFRQLRKIAIFSSILLFAGCYYAPYYANRAAGGGTDAAEGEQHDVPYTANDSFLLTQDVLRGEGILFEVKPDDHLVTLWKDADVGPGVLGSLVGKHPQYRYEIEVVPINPRSSRIIVNVRAEDIPDEDITKYNATTRLNLFAKIDQLAAQFPPSGGTPKEGGVNYALLPNEDLKGLAKRATGNEDNWRQIAQDNGLKSPTDGANLPSIWIRNTLLSEPNKGSAGDK